MDIITIMYIVCFFILGLVLGSFYNVVGYRLPNDLSVLKPKGSFCPKCHHELKWYELIPVFSFLIQGGKCRSCKDKISLFYPFIELTTGILFAVCFYSFGFAPELVVALTLVSLFVIVIVSDVGYYIIPDEVTFISAVIIFITNFFIHGVKGALIQLASGVGLFLVMYLIMVIGSKIMKKECLGGGDVKLMFVVGLALNPILGFITIFLSSFIALPVALIILLVNKEKMIPFGPFILFALLFLYLLKVDVKTVFDVLQIL